MLLRCKGGASGTLWASRIAPGKYNRPSIGIYGTRGGPEWVGVVNDNLCYTPFGESAAAKRSRVTAPSGVDGILNVNYLSYYVL